MKTKVAHTDASTWPHIVAVAVAGLRVVDLEKWLRSSRGRAGPALRE